MLLKEQYHTAVKIATGAHEGQLDKAGEPYIQHPLRVAYRVADARGSTHAQIVALLHDVLEDTDVTAQDLLDAGLDPRIVRAVETITHPPNELYVDYIARVAANPLARGVKIADIRDNTDIMRLHYLDEDTVIRLIKKYRKALKVLLEA